MDEWTNKRTNEWMNAHTHIHTPTDQHKCKYKKLSKSTNMTWPPSSIISWAPSSVWVHGGALGEWVNFEWIKKHSSSYIHTHTHNTQQTSSRESNLIQVLIYQKQWFKSPKSLQRDPWSPNFQACLPARECAVVSNRAAPHLACPLKYS